MRPDLVVDLALLLYQHLHLGLPELVDDLLRRVSLPWHRSPFSPGSGITLVLGQFLGGQVNDQAAREKGDSDLIPYWMAPGSSKVERHVPLLPFSREVEGFRRLKRQLAAYRVVFGQPRQEDLVNLLEKADLEVGNLTEWAIDLSPP